MSKLDKYRGMVGKKFNRILVLEYCKNRNRYVKCKCDCGKIFETQKYRVISGYTKSCGCLHKEVIFKHGKSRSPEYKIWSTMKDRCSNPNNRRYKDYGGRGIKVCVEWQDFSNFYKDMGDRSKGMSIDRIDNNGNYEPSNCQWSTDYIQNCNRRDNVFIEFRGVKRTLAQWARILEIKEVTLWSRLNTSRWPVEIAFTEPVRVDRSLRRGCSVKNY